MKTIREGDFNEKGVPNDEKCFRCPFSWGDRVGWSSMKRMTSLVHFDCALHRRVSVHCKLFRDSCSFGTFFLVAHRNFISYVNLSDKNFSFMTLPPFEDQVLTLEIHRRISYKN